MAFSEYMNFNDYGFYILIENMSAKLFVASQELKKVPKMLKNLSKDTLNE